MEGLKLQYFGYLMQITDSLERILMLGKTEGRRRRWGPRMKLDGITKSAEVNFTKVQVKDRESWHAAVHGGSKELDTM